MRQPLDKTQRNQLEKTVIRARDLVELAAKEALTRLGVAASEAPSYLKEDERKVRNRLRAHARQLGDVLEANGKQGIKRLVSEVGYEHWHRMLFARFLEQNNLLMYDPYTAVHLDECQELAEDEGCKDGWELAGKLAQKMLPQIFRIESPVFELTIARDRVRELEDLIMSLSPQVFQAQDSLGWCYQFWQSKRKEEVNNSGVKIGSEEISPVTQLFTEPYMVSFLIDNALGAWWASHRLKESDLHVASSENELREIASIPGVPLEYLRFLKDEESGIWNIAIGGLEQWPQHLSELKTLDPCCGSGHFLVAIFLMLVPMRMELEELNEMDAVEAVLRDNIHGLELDQRCVEIAAFALALEAWRYPNAGGYRSLPELHLACSGISNNEAQKEWKYLAKDNEKLSEAVLWMQNTFKNAPILGSLIDPKKTVKKGEQPPWKLLQQAVKNEAYASTEAVILAQGLAKTAELLASTYHWTVTNVPYLAYGKQAETLKKFSEKNYLIGRNDLATTFHLRCTEFSGLTGITSAVLPQNWMFSAGYNDFRKNLLHKNKPYYIAQLGSGAFETISGEVVKAILMCVGSKISSSGEKNNSSNIIFSGIDVSAFKAIHDKSAGLKNIQPFKLSVKQQLENPSERIILKNESELKVRTQSSLGEYCTALFGSGAGDKSRFTKFMWEVGCICDETWEYHQTAPATTVFFGGRSEVILWEKEKGQMFKLAESVKHLNHKAQQWRSGKPNWGKNGVAVSLMAKLPRTLYAGDIYAANCTAIVPKPEHGEVLPALWLYCRSQEFFNNIRELNPRLSIEVRELLQVRFDHEKWTHTASELFPKGLPKPHSNDPSQWIFHGHPCGSVVWDEDEKWTTISNKRTDDMVLHVAVARLLGYRWPAELDKEMELADEMRYWVDECDELLDLVDDDGIACLPAIRGEKTAADRLEAMLHAAYDQDWSAKILHDLLQSVGSKNMETWLRDKFFDQHCKLFQHRPFIWQIWDGLKDGFSVLVNYHMLDYKGLERLIYTYLGEWIRTQEHGVKEGIDGADIRLSAAKNLKATLEAILKGDAITGKSGLDIFVRWKPLHEQPVGWNPDLNDGVRLNIRPFMQAQDVGKKGAGILRSKPNIKWNKDRGTDVESAPWYHLGLQYGEKEGARINDHHVSLTDKQKARENAGE